MMIRFIFIFFLASFHQNSFANVGGSDLQNFNPTPNGLDFITVHSSKTLEPGQFNLGSVLTYTTNSLAYSTFSFAPNNQTFAEPNDRLLYSDLHLAIGLLKGWELGASAGFINSQQIDQSNFLFSYGDTGINDIRLHTKARLYQQDNLGFAFMASIDFDQIKNNPFVGDNPGPTINFEAAADLQLSSDILWAVNFGYRLRQAGTIIPNTGVIPLSDQWLYSSALSYTTDQNGSAILGEIYGSYPLEQTTTPTDRQLSNLEILLGYKWKGFKDVDLHGGVGSEAYHGLGSPDIRVYMGLNWRINSLIANNNSYEPSNLNSTQNNDSDRDGVPNPIDQCPNTTQPHLVDETGCVSTKLPQKTQTTDTDGDGIQDSNDRCPKSLSGARVNNFGCEIKAYNH